jgi:hypothetical protein
MFRHICTVLGTFFNYNYSLMLFTGATNLFGFWPNPQSEGLGTTLRVVSFTFLAWVVLPGSYAPASIVLRVIGAGKPLHQDKMAVLEDDCVMYLV